VTLSLYDGGGGEKIRTFAFVTVFGLREMFLNTCRLFLKQISRVLVGREGN
jgi:hypothetical protein